MIDRRIILNALRLILTPVVKFCLRHGVKLPELLEVLKSTLLNQAQESLNKDEIKITLSRLSVMTGLQRREVIRLKEGYSEADNSSGLISKIIGQWQNDKRFSNRQGPKSLSFGFEGSDFHNLIHLISKDLNPATVLFELQRIEAIKISDGKAMLTSPMFIPIGDIHAGFGLLGKDCQDLISAVEENIMESPAISNLHIRTEYDKVRRTALPEIRRWLLVKGHELHREARDFISKYDQDVDPDPNYEGEVSRVVVTSFGKTD